MEEIADNIFIEKDLPGVVLGILKLKHGLIMVDAPFRVEDQQTWKVKCNSLGKAAEKLLIMLDTHIDRTLGVRAMDAAVLGHQNAVEIMTNRPTTARGQDVDAGANWEPYDLPGSIRWVLPNMTYDKQALLHWDDEPVVVTHQPGAHLAASWLRYDPAKVIFVGDSVVVDQPPFLGWADLDTWLKELDRLLSDEFRGFKVVSGRNGVVRRDSVRKMIRTLTQIRQIAAELAEGGCYVEDIFDAVPNLMKKYTVESELVESYQSRLAWGLEQYIRRHYPDAIQKT